MARQNHTAFVPLGSAGNYTANAADLPKVNADVANGEETEIFPNEKTLVLIFNDTIAPFNVSIDSVKDPFGRKKNIVNYSIPIAEFGMFGPFDRAGWAQINGKLNFQIANSALKTAVIKLPG